VDGTGSDHVKWWALLLAVLNRCVCCQRFS